MDKLSKIDKLSKDNIKPVAQGAVGSLLAQLGWVGVPAMMSALATFAAYLAGYGPLWVIVFGAVVLLIVVVAMYLVRIQIEKHRQQLGEPHTGASQVLQVMNVPAMDTEKLENRIKELEQIKTALESTVKDRARTIEQHGTEIARLRRNLETQHVGFEFREQALNNLKAQYGFLHDMADKQAKDISSYLEAIAYFCYYTAEDHLPRFVFGVDIYNKSVFDIAIEDVMEDYVYIGGHELRGSKKIISKSDKIHPSTKGYLTIEQWIPPEQIEIVTKCLNSQLGAFFYLDKLKIMVKGATQFPIERAHLKLQENICSKDRKDGAAAESQKRKLIFEINENQTQVHFSGGSQVRRIEANVHLRFINSDIEPNVIQDMRATLYKQGTPDEEETILERTHVRPGAKPITFIEGVRIDGSTQTPFEFVIFYMEISQETEARLSPDHFLRITMKAMRQSDYVIDFYVNSWHDAHSSNSSIRLK